MAALLPVSEAADGEEATELATSVKEVLIPLATVVIDVIVILLGLELGLPIISSKLAQARRVRLA